LTVYTGHGCVDPRFIAWQRNTAADGTREAHKDDHVREALDAIYGQESSRLDETLEQMQWIALPHENRECDVERCGGIRFPSRVDLVRAFVALSW
jgi:hypothetical protein